MPKNRTIAAMLALFAPVGLLADGGGPDPAGWVFLDSTEDDGPPASWVDMTAGEPMLPGPFELPFAFSLGGVGSRGVTVDSNGGVLFAGEGSECPDGGSWTGFRTGSGEAAIQSRVLGRYPNRGMAFDWATAQLVLLERRSEAVIHIGSVESDAVVGAAASPDSGLAWSCAEGERLTGRTAWFSLSAARSAAHLRSTAHLTEAWWGSRAAEFFGESVAVGQTNEDGLSDALVGQPEMGRAHLFMGSRTAERSDSDDAVLLLTGDGDDRFGHAVLMGDIDDDGLDDLIVGVPRRSGGGAVAIFLASSGLVGERGFGDADAVVRPPESLGSAAFGSSLAIADFTADGRLDLAVGAPDAGLTASFVGAAFVIDGTALVGDVTLTVDAAMMGTEPGDEAGASVAGLGGLLAVGAPGADGEASSSGAVYLIDPAFGGGSLEDAATLRVGGSAEGDLFGTSLASGPLRADAGIALAVGAVGANEHGPRTGAVYVFEGLESMSGTVAAVDAERVISGPEGASAVGSSVALGQLDGDDELELVVGGTGGTSALGGGGMVGVFRSLPVADASLSAADHRLYSADAGGELGSAVAVAEDLQGDGHPDLLIAAPLDSPGARTGAGAVWVWPFVPAYLDDDADGFVAIPAGGLDCDDDDPAVHPNATDGVGDLVDNDCDGWVDGAVIPRTTVDGWRYDLDDVLGVEGGTLFDFEGTEEDAAVDDHYEALGMSLYASGAERSKADVWGAAPVGALGVRVTADSSANDLVLSFGAPVDAVALRILDAETDMRMDAVLGEELVVDGYHFEANGADLAGGVFQAFTFGSPIDRFRIAAATANGWGVDDVEVVFSGGSDRDGDGVTAEDGDCDDFDASVVPGATEVLGDGLDNDCDGVIDGGEADVYLSEGAFVADISILGVRIDFEEPVIGSEVGDHYADLGVEFSAEMEVAGAAGDAEPRGEQLGLMTASTVVLNFTEHQPALAFWLLGADEVVTVEARRDGVSLYEASVPRGHSGFVGMAFPYPVDTVLVHHSISGDEWGIDDVTFSALGLDDADGDGFTEAEGDCDDADASAVPGGEEIWYDGVDGDCGGDDDYDADGDGYGSLGSGGPDCDDFADTTYPGAEDLWYDGLDSDCRGDDDFDADGDGHSSTLFGGTDCDDSEVDVHPDSPEIFYDDVDDDCDPTTDYDADGDGYAASGFAGAIGLYGVGDCDDAVGSTHPDAEETWYDGIDEDCAGDDDFDADGDGHIPVMYGGDDCDDGDGAASPDHDADVCYDGIDADCDGSSDFDCDGDGYDAVDHGGSDCADDDPAVHPGDGVTPLGLDADCDGHVSVEEGGDDCDDGSAAVHPGAEETWYDGIDADCDAADDYDRDGDGHRAAAWAGEGEEADCNDADAGVHPSIPADDCGHGDEDCDGEVDEDCVLPVDTAEEVEPIDTGEPSGSEEDTSAPEPEEETPTDTGDSPEEPPEDSGEEPEDPNADWEPPPSGIVTPADAGKGSGTGGCGCAGAPLPVGWAWMLAGLLVSQRRRGRK